MNSSTIQLAERCQAAAVRWLQTVSPPLSDEQLAISQEKIAAPLPELLVDLYRLVGNGGFWSARWPAGFARRLYG